MTVRKKKEKTTKALTYKDIMIRYLADGVAVLDQLMDQKLLKSDKAKRACRALSTMNKGNAAAFESWLNDHMPSKGRGRELPHLGEERVYIAQQIKGGGVFLRLPLTPLGIKKKQKVKVRFEADRVFAIAA